MYVNKINNKEIFNPKLNKSKNTIPQHKNHEFLKMHQPNFDLNFLFSFFLLLQKKMYFLMKSMFYS